MNTEDENVVRLPTEINKKWFMASHSPDGKIQFVCTDRNGVVFDHTLSVKETKEMVGMLEMLIEHVEKWEQK